MSLSLSPFKLNVYDLRISAGELGVHATTLSRLRKSRYVSVIDAEKNERTYPVRNLMPNKNDYLEIAIASRLNDTLAEEAEEARAFSDDEIAVRTGYARRTMTKYRIRAGIPNSRERQKAYKSDATLKYQIPINFEVVRN
ncbi:MAG: hypothetical protein AABX54_02345 [Nanoarchaeota archaeon]